LLFLASAGRSALSGTMTTPGWCSA